MRTGLGTRLRGLASRLRPETEAAGRVGVPGGSAIATQTRPGLLAGAFTRIARNLAAEQERWLPWCVVAFGAGIAAYFALLTEPPAALAIGIGFAGLLCAVAAPRSSGAVLRFICVLMAAAALGFAAAKVRTLRVDAPVITRDMGPVRLTGRIESVDIRAPNRARIVIAPERLGDGATPLPRKLRLTLIGAKSVATAQPGVVISALAVLRPPPEPALPRGYDFARWAYFQELGGVGFTYGAPVPVEAAPPPGLLDRVSMRIEALRLSMSGRVEAAIPGADGSIAAALITGERGKIDEEEVQAYRDSGLAHVLSISGLHLALAGLGVFWVLRALLALFPSIALTQPIKKWAAVAAFLSASFYLAISGGGSPAVRSYLMLSMMLLGVLADRPALSMRAVALAALVLLIFEPEDLVDPGFQMSFAAVIGLIALAEWNASRARDEAATAGRFGRWWRKGRRYVLAMMLTSLVATLATTPFAIYHFDRAAAYSVLANLLAEPVVAFVIMPSAAFAVLAMPAGLEAAPLHLMGWGVLVMTTIAHWVAELPGATTLVRAWPVSALMAIAFGGLWIALWQRRWRWLGFAPIGIGFALIAASAPPDIFIPRDGQSLAVRGADGKLTILGAHPDEYTAEQWMFRDGDRRDLAAAQAGAQCDEYGCVAKARDGRLVAFSMRAAALVEDCGRAGIVISAVPIRRTCKGPDLVLDRFDALRNGASAVTLGKEIRIETVAAERGKRPWSRRGGSQ